MYKRTFWTTLCLSLLIAGCGKPIEQQPVSKDSKLKVVCTIGMITDVVRVVGGDAFAGERARVPLAGSQAPYNDVTIADYT